MLRAPFKSRPARENSPRISFTHPTPDQIRDGDTPSLPSFRTGGHRMLRAPIMSRPARENSPHISFTVPSPDLITDGDTPSLPSFRTGGHRMLRAPFKSRPAHKNSPHISFTVPSPDLITDGDTSSLPRSAREGIACCEPHSSHARRTRIHPASHSRPHPSHHFQRILRVTRPPGASGDRRRNRRSPDHRPAPNTGSRRTATAPAAAGDPQWPIP